MDYYINDRPQKSLGDCLLEITYNINFQLKKQGILTVPKVYTTKGSLQFCRTRGLWSWLVRVEQPQWRTVLKHGFRPAEWFWWSCGVARADRSRGMTVPVIGPISQPVPLIARRDCPPDRSVQSTWSPDRSLSHFTSISPF